MTTPWPTSQPATTIAKLPADWRGVSEQRVRLRAFHPEDAHLFTARTFGVGWDVNIGALAVRLGLIRADDNLTDLTAHIPHRTARTLRYLPAALSAISLAAGARLVAAGRELPAKWDATLRPRRFTSPLRAISAPLALSVGASAWNAFVQRQAGHDSCDVTAAAHATGIAAGSLLTTAALARAGANPSARQPLVGAGIIAIPAASLAVFTYAVKRALFALDAKLKDGKES